MVIHRSYIQGHLKFSPGRTWDSSQSPMNRSNESIKSRSWNSSSPIWNCCVLYFSRGHSMSTYVCAIVQSECSATCSLAIANAIFRRRAHLSVIRMPIASLENDYGHERRCRSVRQQLRSRGRIRRFALIDYLIIDYLRNLVRIRESLGNSETCISGLSEFKHSEEQFRLTKS